MPYRIEELQTAFSHPSKGSFFSLESAKVDWSCQFLLLRNPALTSGGEGIRFWGRNERIMDETRAMGRNRNGVSILASRQVQQARAVSQRHSSFRKWEGMDGTDQPANL